MQVTMDRPLGKVRPHGVSESLGVQWNRYIYQQKSNRQDESSYLNTSSKDAIPTVGYELGSLTETIEEPTSIISTSFRWSIVNFKEIKDDIIVSVPFGASPNCLYQLVVFPRGCDSTCNGQTAIYVRPVVNKTEHDAGQFWGRLCKSLTIRVHRPSDNNEISYYKKRVEHDPDTPADVLWQMDTIVDCIGFLGFSKSLLAYGFRDAMDGNPIDAALDANGTLHISATMEYESSTKTISRKFCWVIPQIRMRKGQQVQSPTFEVNNYQWLIQIKHQEDDGSMGAYLLPYVSETEKSNDGGWCRRVSSVTFKVRSGSSLLYDDNIVSKVLSGGFIFTPSNMMAGFRSLMGFDEVATGVSVDGTFVIDVEIVMEDDQSSVNSLASGSSVVDIGRIKRLINELAEEKAKAVSLERDMGILTDKLTTANSELARLQTCVHLRDPSKAPPTIFSRTDSPPATFSEAHSVPGTDSVDSKPEAVLEFINGSWESVQNGEASNVGSQISSTETLAQYEAEGAAQQLPAKEQRAADSVFDLQEQFSNVWVDTNSYSPERSYLRTTSITWSEVSENDTPVIPTKSTFGKLKYLSRAFWLALMFAFIGVIFATGSVASVKLISTYCDPSTLQTNHSTICLAISPAAAAIESAIHSYASNTFLEDIVISIEIKVLRLKYYGLQFFENTKEFVKVRLGITPSSADLPPEVRAELKRRFLEKAEKNRIAWEIEEREREVERQRRAAQLEEVADIVANIERFDGQESDILVSSSASSVTSAQQTTPIISLEASSGTPAYPSIFTLVTATASNTLMQSHFSTVSIGSISPSTATAITSVEARIPLYASPSATNIINSSKTIQGLPTEYLSTATPTLTPTTATTDSHDFRPATSTSSTQVSYTPEVDSYLHQIPSYSASTQVLPASTSTQIDVASIATQALTATTEVPKQQVQSHASSSSSYTSMTSVEETKKTEVHQTATSTTSRKGNVDDFSITSYTNTSYNNKIANSIYDNNYNITITPTQATTTKLQTPSTTTTTTSPVTPTQATTTKLQTPSTTTTTTSQQPFSAPTETAQNPVSSVNVLAPAVTVPRQSTRPIGFGMILYTPKPHDTSSPKTVSPKTAITITQQSSASPPISVYDVPQPVSVDQPSAVLTREQVAQETGKGLVIYRAKPQDLQSSRRAFQKPATTCTIMLSKPSALTSTISSLTQVIEPNQSMRDILVFDSRLESGTAMAIYQPSRHGLALIPKTEVSVSSKTTSIAATSVESPWYSLFHYNIQQVSLPTLPIRGYNQEHRISSQITIYKPKVYDNIARPKGSYNNQQPQHSKSHTSDNMHLTPSYNDRIDRVVQEWETFTKRAQTEWHVWMKKVTMEEQKRVDRAAYHEAKIVSLISRLE
ncbi:hypothetical protein HDU76_005824, partial [Blyttiomyces sp. JEL0837]